MDIVGVNYSLIIRTCYHKFWRMKLQKTKARWPDWYYLSLKM